MTNKQLYDKEFHRIHAGRDRANKQARARVFRDAIWSAKAAPCFDCDVRYPPYVMQFDHREPAEKEFGIATANRTRLDRVRAEMAKCDVVCANCHAERTWKRKNTVLHFPGHGDSTEQRPLAKEAVGE
jgi:hypothetical protein